MCWMTCPATSSRPWSAAIDIVVPYNFWRTLYFATGGDGAAIKVMQDTYAREGEVRLPEAALRNLRSVFCSAVVSDEQTLRTMNEEFVRGGGGGYLMCPHTAVAMAAVAVPGLLHCGAAPAPPLPPGSPIVVVATAHPSKFGHTVRNALGMDLSAGNGGSGDLPGAARHPSVEAARGLFHRRRGRAWQKSPLERSFDISANPRFLS